LLRSAKSKQALHLLSLIANIFDPSTACSLKEKNSLLFKQLFFFDANYAGCVPVKQAKAFTLKANSNNKTTREG
jgi:hypothetical protein